MGLSMSQCPLSEGVYCMHMKALCVRMYRSPFVCLSVYVCLYVCMSECVYVRTYFKRYGCGVSVHSYVRVQHGRSHYCIRRHFVMRCGSLPCTSSPVLSAQKKKRRALHAACVGGHAAVVNALIAAGADVKAADVCQPYTVVVLHAWCELPAVLLLDHRCHRFFL
jgi:hypothetical protein